MIDQILLEKTCEAVRLLYGSDLIPSAVGLEKTKKGIPGDYTIVVFPMTKVSRKSPEITAIEIGNLLLTFMPEIDHFQVIKGFLNIFLKNEFWIGFLKSEHDKKEFGFTRKKEEIRISLNIPRRTRTNHCTSVISGITFSDIPYQRY